MIYSLWISIHALLAESDASAALPSWSETVFQSTLSLRRATSAAALGQGGDAISIHALLAESDLTDGRQVCLVQISIHALLAESDLLQGIPHHLGGISIHALLAESDRSLEWRCIYTMGISIHALLAESDEEADLGTVTEAVFQSTLSLRRATPAPSGGRMPAGHFNPRSPCGERHLQSLCKYHHDQFQSTLSLRRATPGSFQEVRRIWRFQSTLSLRRATHVAILGGRGAVISIHALLAESDVITSSRAWGRLPFQSTLSLRRATVGCAGHEPDADDFNPRSPCGERPPSPDHGDFIQLFQSTLSLRRATTPRCTGPPWYADFNPRSPCGERQQIPPNWPYRFCLKCQFKDGEKSKKAKGSASAQASSPAYEKNKVRIPWGDFECFRFAPIK